ncbi:MAG: transcription repair coupling factor, partial [Tardiphaga sp.]|nr:transcription repair coupling factor [Tardiphaga sp.]
CDDGDSEASESSRRFATATVFEYRPSARLIADHGMGAHARRWFDRVAGDDASLFLTRKDWERCLADGDAVVLPATSSEPDLPTFYSDNSSTRSFRNFLGQKEKDGRRIIFAAATKRDLRAMDRRAGIDSTLCDSWSQAVNAPRRHPAALLADLDRGFESADGCVVVSAVDLFGSRATHQDIMSVGLRKNIGDRELSFGDVVIHLDRGMAILSELATVVTEGVPDAEMIRLEFADKDHILLPVSDLKAIWRYSSESDGIRLDKADGSSWLARRGQAEADIVATASHISERIAERRERRTAPIVPPAADYENFAAGFEYSITADQGRAIADVLSDLASHRPMDRLICGDVGYGKTEVALRATAATVLAGKQVAIVAPTTVLALQHLETFRRRFKPLGLVVGLLSRFTTTTDARAIKKALADGSLSIVIGTHALAGKSVTFKKLGLLVIDEEQHLGQVQKAKLAALANELHVLTMTATPIPRTLNEVRAGLRALSIISTPPVRRMPVKTIVEPFNDAVVTSALRREHRRRGQSFLVCPRVQDIAPMAQKLQGLVPELKTIAVHGKMPAADIDKAMLTFAARGADILLATDIIESGLDLPHANTIIVWRPDKFGLAQLHQLRGRVGRRSARAFALFLTDPAAKLSSAAVARLDKLQKLNDQGAGFLISAGDMDMRGGGDLLSEKQSGHIQLLGSDLSAHLLDLAIGDAAPASLFEKRPEVRLDVPALLPAAYVKDASIRLELYARIFRCGSARELENVEDEIEERFGDLPSEASDLLRLARFELVCVTLGIMSVDVGPKSLAATFDPARGRKLPKSFRADDRLEWKDGRLIYRRPSAPPER